MDWTDTSTGVGETANMPLISKYKAQSKKVAPKVLEAVNKLQKVRFVVSPSIIEAAKDMQLNIEKYRKDSRFSTKEITKEANDIYVEIINYQHADGYFFPVTMDARGRMYYRGGLLSPQGVDFCKAAFQFKNKMALGINGFHAICIHTANVLGMDKVSITERRKYVHKNWDTIISCKTHMDVRTNFPKADTFQALVACVELAQLAKWSSKENAVKDFMSGLVCHQDGTCNGLQHMAAVTGDRATAIAVNCVASTFDEVPSDVYGLVANEAVNHAETQPAIDFIHCYGRDMAKNPVMITSYGASESTIVKNTSKFLSTKKVATRDSKEIGAAYLGAISVVAGAVTQLTNALKICVTNTLIEQPEKTKFTWVTADGFIACTEYRSEEQFRVRAGVLAARIRGLGKAQLDKVKTKGAMAPNFIHSIDATHLRMVVRAANHDLVTVHDSIGSHAATYFDTATIIREKFVVVHAYDALDDLCFGMRQTTPEFDGDYCAQEALQSAYIFS
jgi:DNA-directed RNA polymerase